MTGAPSCVQNREIQGRGADGQPYIRKMCYLSQKCRVLALPAVFLCAGCAAE